jgi:endoglucanase
MYADMVAAESASKADTYRCWGLSQLRYMLGDSGRSLVVGYGRNPPRRTQDRGAACPESPAVCNRVTGLLSPDPDVYELTGALVHGPGFSDDFIDVRSIDSARVGVENNAGFTAALAGATLLPEGMWEVCLQKFGIFRSNPVCGTFLNI